MYAGWWIVATHFTVQFFASGFFVYSLPLLFEPMIQTFDTDRATVNGLPSLATLLGMVVAPLAGPLVDRWSARGLMLIGTLAMVLGLFGMSVATGIGQLVVVGAVCFSIANTLVGPLTGSAVVSRWFVEARGRALGIAAIGTSAGGILLPMAIGVSLESVGWRQLLQLIAVGVLVFALPLVLFRFWDQPADRGLEAAGAARPTTGGAGGGGRDEPEPATSGEILRRPAFWLLSVCLGLFLAAYTATLANLGQFGGDLGVEPERIGQLVGTLAVAGIVGKLSFGYLADRLPLKIGLTMAIGATAVALFVFSLEPDYPLMLLGGVAMGLASGGILPVWNALVAAIFGVANFGRAMGLMSPVLSLLITPAFPILGAVRDATGSYVPAFQGLAGVLLLAVLLLIPLRVEGPERRAGSV